MLGVTSQDPQVPFEIERPIIQSLVNRPFRDRAFRRAVLQAYDARCAVTGGSSSTAGAGLFLFTPQAPGAGHPARLAPAYRPARVRACGRLVADRTSALQLGVRQVNDRPSVEAIVNRIGKALVPELAAMQPHPAFLGWHREYCFKH